jgi:hypothetical protein
VTGVINLLEQGKKSHSSLLIGTAILTGVAVIFASVTAPAYAAMYGTIHSFSLGKSWQYVRGTIATPSPSMDSWSHKTYIAYMQGGSIFTAGSGIYIYKNSATSSIVKCYLMLYANDYPGGASNFLSCSTAPSGNIAVKVEQTTNGGSTWKGTSGANTYTYTFTQNPYAHPPSYGAASGGTTDNLSMYSSWSALKIKEWGQTEQTFNQVANGSPQPLYKCYTNTGYKYDNSDTDPNNAFGVDPVP